MSSPLRLAAALAPLVTLPMVAAPAAADQSYPVPAGRVFTVHGHGFGHGHGMSQYGADGAASQGRTYRQILSFYYPGTRRALLRSRIRVLVSADTTRDLVVSPARGLVVHDLGSGVAYRLPVIAGVRRWRLNVDGTSGHLWKFVGGQVQAVGSLR